MGVVSSIESKIKEDKNRSSALLPSPTAFKKEGNKTVDKGSIEKESDEDIVSLSPIIPVVDLEDESSRKEKKERAVSERKKTKKKSKHRRKKLVKAKKSEYIIPKELHNNLPRKERKEKKKVHIDIKTSSSNYINIMKDKFQKNKNPREALLIAKAYYRAGNYKESEKWALKANGLNRNLEESWLLFAKSKNALAQKDEALKILITYYNKTRSPKVRLLIEKISSKSKSI